MGLWVNFMGLAITAIVLGDRQASSFPARQVPMLMNAYGNPMVLMRATRNPEPIYPQRAMMLTGFYQPARRTNQASGVFAQGNAVSGGAYFGGKDSPNYLQRNSQPEEELSSAEAEASPALQDNPNDYGGDSNYPPPTFNQADQPGLEQNPTFGNDEPVNFPTEAPVEVENPTTASTQPPKVYQPVKKNKKTTTQVEESEDEEDEDDDEEEEVFAPLKPPKRRGNMPNFNNFFPMVFSMPKSYGRRASSGSPPGMITAIANSYSTGKGGVASSVATAYGGSPNGKKKRDYTTQ